MTLAQLIAQRARRRGLNPQIPLVVSAGEGLSDQTGDVIGGRPTSFGPFMLHEQGALPKQFWGRPQAALNWANSAAGIDYALARIAPLTRGLGTGAAVENVIRRFERPADPNTSVARARARLRSGNFGGGGSALLPPPASPGFQQPPATPQRRGLDPALASVFASNAALLGVPSPDPSLLTEPPTTQKVGRLETGQGALPVEKDFGGRTTPRAQKALKLAQEYLGTPYAWGGGGPAGPSRGTGRGANTVGFDCSSFIQYLWAKQGVNVPRTTYEQFKTGKKVGNIAGLRPGDTVFFHMGKNGPEHEGIFLGNGQFMHAPHTGDVVKISRITDPYYRQTFVGGRRYT